MKPPAHLPESVATVWVEIITAYGDDAHRIVGPDLDAYCGVIARWRDAQHRIETEGLVVQDLRGNPIPHPAVSVEKACQDEIRKWGDKFKPRRRR